MNNSFVASTSGTNSEKQLASIENQRSSQATNSDTAPPSQVPALTQEMSTPTLKEYLQRKANGENIGWVDTREKIKNDLVTGAAKLARKFF